MTRNSAKFDVPFVGGHADVWRIFDRFEAFSHVTENLVLPFRGKVTKVAGIESRGFILGTAAALTLGVGFVAIRKEEGLFPGPKATVQADLDYRGRSNTLRIQRAAISSGDRILLVDDWIETGNQALAAKRLIECCGAEMVGIATVVTQAPAEVLDRLGQAHALIRADQLAGHQPPQQNV